MCEWLPLLSCVQMTACLFERLRLPFSTTALYTGGRAEKRATSRTSRVLHHEDATLQGPRGATGRTGLHCLLYCPLRGK